MSISSKELVIWVCGFYCIAFGIFHVFFWKLFKWRTGLQNLSKINKAIIQIANCRLIFLFFALSYLCFFFTEELHSSGIGKAILMGCSLFCAGRTIEQFIFLRINNKAVHFLTFAFIAGTVLFLLPLL